MLIDMFARKLWFKVNNRDRMEKIAKFRKGLERVICVGVVGMFATTIIAFTVEWRIGLFIIVVAILGSVLAFLPEVTTNIIGGIINRKDEKNE